MQFKHRFLFYTIFLFFSVYLRCSSGFIAYLDPDSSGYLEPAINFIEDSNFHHLHARSYAYPLFLALIIAFIKNINAVVIVQHVLSVISFIFIMIHIEKRLLSHHNSGTKHTLIVVLSIIFLFLLMFDGQLIFYEKNIRPEGILFSSMVLYLYIIDKSFKTISNILSKKWLFLFFSYSFFLILLHPRFTVGIYIILFYTIIILLFKRGFFFSTNAIKILIILTIAYLIIMKPEKKLIAMFDDTTPAFAYKQFFYSNAPTVLKSIDNGNIIFAEYDNEILKEKLNQGLYKNPNNTTYFLGFYIDYIQYEIGDAELKDLLKSNENKLAYNHYYKKWFKLLIKKYPVDLIKKTMQQLSVAYFYSKFEYIHYVGENKYTNQYQNNMDGYIFLKEKMSYREDEFKIKYPYTLTMIYYILSPLIRILFFLATIFHLFKFILSNEKFSLKYLLVLLVTSSILLVAFTHTFDIIRYMTCMTVLIYGVIFLFLHDLIRKFIP